MKGKEILETHTLLVPYCDMLFGKTSSLVGEVTFEVSDSEEEGLLKILTFTGTSGSGKVYDLSYLADVDSDRFLDLIDGILGNKDNWDNREVWW